LASIDESTLALAWLEYTCTERSEGERISVSLCSDGVTWSPPRHLTELGEFIRPSLAGGFGKAFLTYSSRSGGTWSILSRAFVDGEWRKEEAAVLASYSPALNQEGVVAPDGRLWMVFQALNARGRYSIYLTARSVSGAWSYPLQVSEGGSNNWDPVIAQASDDSRWIVWSTFDEGSYKLNLRRHLPDGSLSAPKLLPMQEPEAYAVHPAVVAHGSGQAWIAYDEVLIKGHGRSGCTAYLPAGELERPDRGLARQADVHSSARLILVDDEGGGLLPPPPLSEATGSSGLPRICAQQDDIWMAFRVRRPMPFFQSYYDLVVTSFVGGSWSTPLVLPMSDGPASESALAVNTEGMWAAWYSDNRKERTLRMIPQFGGAVQEEDGLLDHLGSAVWDSHQGVGSLSVALLVQEESRTTGSDGGKGALSVAISPSPLPSATATANQNPVRHRDVLVSNQQQYTLYWGDLHKHSNISRCALGLDPDLEDQFRYARDVSEYDFWAMTDHAEHTSPFEWWRIRKLSRLFHVDGAHVVLCGFEWTSYPYGHMNVIYAGTEGPIFSAEDHRTDDPVKLWSALQGLRAITIPHHPSHRVFPTDWNYYDEEFVRVAEVFQAATGSYEGFDCFRQSQAAVASGSSIKDGLSRGRRIGLICSTDHGYGTAYTGVFAKSLAREDIFEGLRARRCLGSTTRGLIPNLHINGALMGEVLDGVTDSLSIEIQAAAEAELSKVHLISNSGVAWARDLESRQSKEHDTLLVPLDIVWESAQGGPRSWHGTVVVDGGGTIVPTQHWSPKIAEVKPRRVSWNDQFPERDGFIPSPPSTGGIGVTVEGRPASTLVIEALGMRIERTLEQLVGDNSPISLSSRLASLRVARGVGGLTGLGVQSLTWKGELPLPARPSWFYVRALQVDGEVAWTSPIWVDV
jgi:hypothetical protein